MHMAQGIFIKVFPPLYMMFRAKLINNNKNIKCPNPECKSITEKDIQSNITYIKYNENDMKYIYICKYCGQKWKNN